MAYERKRKAIIIKIGETFEALPKFADVQYHVPIPGESYPDAEKLPSIHIDRSVENTSDLTNVQRESGFGLEIIGTVMSTERLALAKCEIEEDIEEAIYSLMTDDEFREMATQIKITSIDATPYSLVPLGASVPILPPYGVVRVSAVVTFAYNV